jgi:signal transduction histidine kinase
VWKCLALLEQEAQESGISLSFSPGEHLPLCMLDEKQIHQVLLNLIRNAFEALLESPDRDEPPRVEVSTRAEENAVELDVRDNGPGMSQEVIDEIFEPFISSKVSGTGLGLAVGRKIMLDHGGNVSVASEPGQGAVFTLTLPLAAEGA